MKEHIRSTCNLTIKMVPPGCHRRNAAEVAIRNFKSHFISILAGVAEDFPPTLWDRLLPQTEITLNLIQQSNATPNVLAYAHISRPFDYNKMPLAPMGGNTQIHKKADSRGTWVEHSVDGWYLYTSPEHYRTHACHIKSTRHERLSDTVDFKHKRITNPTITHANKIMHAIKEVVKTIKGMGGEEASDKAQELQQLVDGASHQLARRTQRMDTGAARFEYARDNHNKLQERQEPATWDNTRHITRSMSIQPSLPRVTNEVHKPVPTNPTPHPPRQSTERQRSRSHTTTTPSNNDNTLASRT